MGLYERQTVTQTGETVMAYLERTRELWLPHYRRAERDGRMNAELNADADFYLPRLDQLLDELNAIGYFALKRVVHEHAA